MTEKNDLTKKAKDEETKANDKALKEQFQVKNIKKISEIEKHISTNMGEKIKIIEVREYKNGVIKRKVIEVVKSKNKRKTTPRTLESLKNPKKEKK